MNVYQRIVASLALAAVSPVLLAAPQGAQKTPARVAQASKEALATGTWTVDKPHTDISFTVVHLGITKTHGSFTDFDGTVIADGKKPENSSVQFAIKTASINTNNPQRDGHLKSNAFFDAEKYPEITFKSTKVSRTKTGFVAAGNLTMHGVTKPVSLPFTVTGPQKGGKGEMHMGIETALKLDRKDYGLTWNAVVEGTQAVSEIVDINISMDITK